MTTDYEEINRLGRISDARKRASASSLVFGDQNKPAPSGTSSSSGFNPPKLAQYKPLFEKYFRPGKDVTKAMWVAFWGNQSADPSIIAGEVPGQENNPPQGRATGLIQALPSFYNDQGVLINAGRPSQKELQDPETNIRFAASLVYGVGGKDSPNPANWKDWQDNYDPSSGQKIWGELAAHPFPDDMPNPKPILPSNFSEQKNNARTNMEASMSALRVASDNFEVFKVQAAQKKKKEITALSQDPRFILASKANLVTGKVSSKEYNEAVKIIESKYDGELSELKLQNAAIADAAKRTEQYFKVLDGLEVLVADKNTNIRNVDDLEKFINETAGTIDTPFGSIVSSIAQTGKVKFSQSERDYLDTAIKHLAPYINRPEQQPASHQQLTEFLAAASSSSVPSKRISIASLSTNQIASLLKTLPSERVQLPAGLTAEKLRAYYASQNLLDEKSQRAIDALQGKAADLVRQWQGQDARYEAYKLGLADPSNAIPTLKAREFNIATWTVEKAEVFAREVVRPIATYGTIGLGHLQDIPILGQTLNITNPLLSTSFNTPLGRIGLANDDIDELRAIVRKNKMEGQNWWEAAGNAFEEWDTGVLNKMLLETIADPTTYLGFGIYPKLFKPIPYLGKSVAAGERGWKLAFENPIATQIATAGVGGLLGYTIAPEGYEIHGAVAGAIFPTLRYVPLYTKEQLTQRVMRNLNYLQNTAIMTHTNAKTITTVTTEQVMDTLETGFRYLQENPTTHNLTPQAQWVKSLLDTVNPWLDEDTISTWAVRAQSLQPTTVEGSPLFRMAKAATKDQTLAVNNTIDKLLYSEERGIITLDQASDEIANILGVSGSREAIRQGILDTFDIQLNRIRELVKGPNGSDAFISILDGVKDSALKNFDHPLDRWGQFQGFIIGLNRKIDPVTRSKGYQWMANAQNWYAQSMLKFFNFKPFNYLETHFRAALGGGGWEIPVLADEITTTGYHHSWNSYYPKALREGGRGNTEFIRVKKGDSYIAELSKKKNLLRSLGDLVSLEFLDDLAKQKQAAFYEHRIWAHFPEEAPELYRQAKTLADNIRSSFHAEGLSDNEISSRLNDLMNGYLRPDAPTYIRTLKTDLPTATKKKLIRDIYSATQKYQTLDQLVTDKVIRDIERGLVSPEAVNDAFEENLNILFDMPVVKAERGQVAIREVREQLEKVITGEQIPANRLPRLEEIDLIDSDSVISAPSVAYHGSGTRINQFAEGMANPEALYGPGVYLTSDPIVSQGYADNAAKRLNARRTRELHYSSQKFVDENYPEGNPFVHRVNISPDIKLLNLQQPMPIELAPLFQQMAERFPNEADAWEAAAKAIREGESGIYTYGAFKTPFTDFTSTEAGEALQSFNDLLREQGYGGITHIGGGRYRAGDTNRHNVTIIFDESKLTPEIAGLDAAQMFGLMKFVNESIDSIDSTAATLRQTATERAHRLSGEAVDEHWNTSNNALYNYTDIAANEYRQMVEAVRSRIAQFFPTEVDRLNGVLDNMVQRNNLLMETRRKDAEVFENFERDRGHKVRTSEERTFVNSQREDIWNNYRTRETNLRIEYQVLADDFSPSLGNVTDVSAKGLSLPDVAALMKSSGDELAQSLVVNDSLVSRETWVASVYGTAKAKAQKLGSTPELLGWTKEAVTNVYNNIRVRMGTDPAEDSILLVARQELDNLRKDVHYQVMNAGYNPETIDIINDGIEQFAKFSETSPAPREAVRRTYEKTRLDFEHTFTDYDNQNIFDAWMRGIFPFWFYQASRWPYLATEALRHPGLISGFGRYQNYTEKGYTPIPGADLAFNIARGTILMGGMSGLIRQYPARYEDGALGDFAHAMDSIGKAGFYPGLWTTLPLAAFRINDFELSPPIESGLNLWHYFTGNETASNIRDRLFPSKFREYYQSELASKLSQERNLGYSGSDIRRRIELGIASEEEKAVWKEASRDLAGYQTLFDQTGILKLDIQAKKEASREIAEFIYQETGISIEQQDAITDRLGDSGYRLLDIFPLDPAAAKRLYEMTRYKYWSGSATALQPKEFQQLTDKINTFWEQVEGIQKKARETGFEDRNGNHIPSLSELDQQFKSGQITARDYLKQSSVVKTKQAEAIDTLKKDPHYNGVPITLEQRKQYREKNNLPMPVQHPSKELLDHYHEIVVENDSTGEPDWNMYFASIDGLLQALPQDKKDYFLDYIQRTWTPTQKLYWQTNGQFIRPYMNLREAIIQAINPSQAAFLREYEDASSAKIKNLSEEEQKLVSDYNSALGRARERFRQLDPETDAWLFYWGKTSTVQSEAARRKYNEIITRFGGGITLNNPIDETKKKILPALA